MANKSVMWVGFIVYVVFGLYVINMAFEYFKIPESVSSFSDWIFVIAGLLLVWGGVNFLRVGMGKARRQKVQERQ